MRYFFDLVSFYNLKTYPFTLSQGGVNRQGNATNYGHLNTFTAIVDLSRSNFSIARAPLFQLQSAT